MVTDPIQHDRAKGDRRRMSRRRVIRGASYSIYDTLSSHRATATAHASDNVGHVGFRVSLTLSPGGS